MKDINHQKQETYAMLKPKLNKALASEFYYEAIFIEYAIIEDRLESLLKHAGVKYQDKDGRSISINAKLNKVENVAIFNEPYIRKRISIEFIESIRTWKNNRNGFTHAMMSQPYNPELLKDVALEGKELVKDLDNKVKSINKYLEKTL